MSKYIKILSIAILVFVSENLYSQRNNKELDSLLGLLKYQKEDSNQVNLLNEIALKFYKTSPDSALIFSEEALNIALEKNFTRGIGNSYKIIGIVYYIKSDFKLSLENYFNALKYSEEINDEKNLLSVYNNIALIYLKLDDYNNALPFFKKALDLLDYNDLSLKKASILLNIGTAYDKLDSTENAIEFYEKSLKLRYLHNDSVGIASCSNNIGYILYKQNNYKKALTYFLKSKELLEDKEEYFEITTIYINIARVYSNIGIPSLTEKYFNLAMESAEKSGSDEMVMEVYNDKFQHYEKYHNYKKAFYNLKAFYSLKDSIFSKETAESITEMRSNYEIDKKEKENEVLRYQQSKNDAIIRQQEYFGYLSVGALIFMIVVAFFLLLTALQRKKANSQLQYKNAQIYQQKEEILTQNNILENQKEELIQIATILEKANNEISIQKAKIEYSHNQITASINYAKNIQKAMLSGNTFLNENFSESFIFYEPKDIVSGDFYWFKKIKNHILIAAADCTGHGIPGAFLSMLGISLLNESVRNENLSDAASVLDILRENVINTLNQAGNETKYAEGMDMAFISIDPETLKLQFAGAYSSLYIIRNENSDNVLIELKPDKQPIGLYVKPKPFTNHEFQLKKNDTIYMFSDGFQDQIGGNRMQKFKINKLKEILISIQGNSLNIQKEKISQTFFDWKSNNIQIDDVMMLAIKI
jgi:serine phosphatase RsbU (regulator of sigma subunit)/tetratricopeptide (TPR) repeat protein